MAHDAVTDVWVHGRHVVADAHLTTLDEGALVARVAALTKDWTI